MPYYAGISLQLALTTEGATVRVLSFLALHLHWHTKYLDSDEKHSVIIADAVALRDVRRLYRLLRRFPQREPLNCLSYDFGPNCRAATQKIGVSRVIQFVCKYIVVCTIAGDICLAL